jgi:hypothetical protein
MFTHYIAGIKTWKFDCGWFNNFVQKNISNAFDNVPFGDEVHGLLGSVPAKMLHVSGTGLLKHMVGCLYSQIGGTKSKKDKESFDDLCPYSKEPPILPKCVVPKELVIALCYSVQSTLI